MVVGIRSRITMKMIINLHTFNGYKLIELKVNYSNTIIMKLGYVPVHQYFIQNAKMEGNKPFLKR